MLRASARQFSRLLVATACALGPLALPLTAAAQSSAEDKAELKRLRSMFQQAIELEHAGNWGGALQLFREIGQTRMTPQVRFHIAACEEKLGKLVAALGGYEMARVDAESVGADFQAEVEGAVETLRQKIPMLTIERGRGAAAAAIEVDGVSLGSTSLNRPFPADPGPHAVSAKAPGFKELVTVVELAEGERRSFVVELEPSDSPATLRAPGEEPEPPGERPEGKAPSRVVPYVIGGVGAASLLGAGVLFYLRQDSLSKLEEACPNGSCPKESEPEYDSFTTYHYGSQIALGVGVVGIGTAVTLILLEPKRKSPAQTGVRLVPSFSQSSGGLRMLGSF